jgi:tetratricopeptide (TPR) repeat protein
VAALIAAGRADHMAGRLDEAAVVYESILAQSPEEADALHLLGMLRVAQGRASDGIALLHRAAARVPTLPAVWYNLGVALTGDGQAEAAAAAFQRAVALDPRYADAHFLLAMAAKAAGRVDDAVAGLRAALAANPTDANLLNRLGTAFADAELLDEAEDCLRRAVARAPGDARSQGNLGILLQRRERLDEAVASYRRAAALTPQDPAAHARLGTAVRQLIAECAGAHAHRKHIRGARLLMHADAPAAEPRDRRQSAPREHQPVTGAQLLHQNRAGRRRDARPGTEAGDDELGPVGRRRTVLVNKRGCDTVTRIEDRCALAIAVLMSELRRYDERTRCSRASRCRSVSKARIRRPRSQPAPIRIERQQLPDRPSHRPGEMRDRGVGRDDEIELRNERRGVGEVADAAAVVRPPCRLPVPLHR